MIYQSVAKQYGILPERQNSLHYRDWILLIGGLMEDTPLGQTVLIRKEENRDRLKNFTRHEHRIRNEWRNFRAKQKSDINKNLTEDFALQFEKMFGTMFG